MAGKCCIAGTARKIVGGKAMVSGTVRKITRGKTMVGGVVLEIPFQREVGELTVHIKFNLMSEYATGGIHFIWGDGSQAEEYYDTEMKRQVTVGDEITVYSFSDYGTGYSELSSGDEMGCIYNRSNSEEGVVMIDSVPAEIELNVLLYG